MRQWSLRLFLVDEDGNERPADVFTKVVYNLHPTFENPTQSEFNFASCDPETPVSRHS
jgi:transcription initiation factor TFIID/TFIIF subunit